MVCHLEKMDIFFKIEDSLQSLLQLPSPNTETDDDCFVKAGVGE